MNELLKNMIKRAWGIVISGNATWDEIASEKAPIKAIRNHYVFPWIIISSILAFVCSLFYASGKMFETAIINTIVTAISLTGGYFISNLACFAYLKKYKPELSSRTNCETLIAYSYTIIILIDIVTIIAPSLSFLKVLCIFVVYEIWEGCRAIWLLKEDERGNIVLIFSATVILVPIIINKFIHWMLPNI